MRPHQAAAVNDYSEAIKLWGGDNALATDGINPYVLTFRGNALAAQGQYDAAITDYRRAESVFSRVNHDRDMAAQSRANAALAAYEIGRTAEAEREMRSIVKRTPGLTDMHVCLPCAGAGALGVALCNACRRTTK